MRFGLPISELMVGADAGDGAGAGLGAGVGAGDGVGAGALLGLPVPMLADGALPPPPPPQEASIKARRLPSAD